MKKKLFALMLSCACIASNSYASLDLSNQLPRSSSIKWCLDDSAWAIKKSDSLKLTCGDFERLTSLAELSKTVQTEIPSQIAVNHAEETPSLRPPALTPPTSCSNPPSEQVTSDIQQIWSAENQPSLPPEFFAWAQESLLQSTTMAARWIGEPRRKTVDAISDWIVQKIQKSNPNIAAASIGKNIILPIDPIRTKLILEDYRPYDLSINDALWARRSFLPSQLGTVAGVAEPQNDWERQRYSAEFLAKPVPEEQKAINVAREVVVKPIQIDSQGSAFFVRKIPIDYSIVSEPVHAKQDESNLAEISGDSDARQLYSVDLQSTFGTNVLPVIDFHRTDLRPYLLAKSLDFYGLDYTKLKIPNWDKFVVNEVPRTKSLKEVIYETGDQAARQAISLALKQLKSSLNQAEAWVESLEFALNEQESVKVAKKPSMNR
jgi:hypothetical protein